MTIFFSKLPFICVNYLKFRHTWAKTMESKLWEVREHPVSEANSGGRNT